MDKVKEVLEVLGCGILCLLVSTLSAIGFLVLGIIILGKFGWQKITG